VLSPSAASKPFIQGTIGEPLCVSPEFVYVHLYRDHAGKKKLWEALTSSEFSRRYWFGTRTENRLENWIAVSRWS